MGLLALAEVVPVLGFGILGGAVADAVDRRTAALLSEIGLAATAALFAVNAALPTRRCGRSTCSAS